MGFKHCMVRCTGEESTGSDSAPTHVRWQRCCLHTRPQFPALTVPPPGKKKKDNYRQPVVESQSLSCVRGGSHFRAAVEPTMVVRDDPVGPPCAAPFKEWTASPVSLSLQDSQPAPSPGNKASHILSMGSCPFCPVCQPPTIARRL